MVGANSDGFRGNIRDWRVNLAAIGSSDGLVGVCAAGFDGKSD